MSSNAISINKPSTYEIRVHNTGSVEAHGINVAASFPEYIESMIYSYGYYFGQIRVDPVDPEVVYTMGVPIVRSDDGGKTYKSINEDNVHQQFPLS